MSTWPRCVSFWPRRIALVESFRIREPFAERDVPLEGALHKRGGQPCSDSDCARVHLRPTDAWDLSMLEAEQGVPVVWGWALRRLPGVGLICCIGIWNSVIAMNE